MRKAWKRLCAGWRWLNADDDGAGGEEFLVTNQNKKEYVDLYVKYLLDESIAQQFSAFAEGFHEVRIH